MLKLIGEDYAEVLEYMHRFKVDLNPTSLGISQDDFVRCMQEAPGMRRSRFTCLNTRNLNETRLREIYHELINEL